MMMSALYQTNTHSWIFIVLVHIHNIPQVNTRAPHPDSLPTGLCPYSIIMRADQKNKKNQQQIPVLWSLIGPDRYSNSRSTIYHTRGEFADHYTTDAVQTNIKYCTLTTSQSWCNCETLSECNTTNLKIRHTDQMFGYVYCLLIHPWHQSWNPRVHCQCIIDIGWKETA